MNTFIMFVGLPGSGKSTFIEENDRAITQQYGITGVISSDAIVQDVADSRGLTYAEVFQDSINLAGKYIDCMLGILSLQQRNFILDQTGLTAKTRRRKLGLLTHANNYHKIAVVFDNVPDDEIMRRIVTRGVETGKVIPEHVIQSMRNSFEYPQLYEGFNKIMTVQEFKDSLPEFAESAPTSKYGEMKFG